LDNPSIGSLVLNVRDITARKQTEEALLQSEARLNQLNATKDKFFSIIAHDLRSPFNSIMGFSNLLEDQIQRKNYQGIEEYAAIIQKSSNRALALLRNLLEWARSQTGSMVFKPEPIEIVALMKEVTDLLNDSAKQKAIVISMSIPPMATVLADREMMGTTLRNLLSNAIKFTNPGGEIVLSAQQKNGQWIINVTDNGVGIQKEALEKLFRIDQSYTTAGTQNERGTGLGLILCKEFVEKHGGRIWVESQVMKGSKFCFTIPA
jgi:signal transduction histidine kinase